MMGLRPGLHCGLGAGDHIAAVRRHRRRGHMTGSPIAARLAKRPGQDDLAGHDPLEQRLLIFGSRSAQGVGHHVGGHERPRHHAPAHLIGHDGEIHNRPPRDAAPAQRFGHHQRGPAQFGRGLPPALRVSVGQTVPLPRHADRHLGLDKPTCGFPEELLIVAQIDSHRGHSTTTGPTGHIETGIGSSPQN